MTQIWLCTMSRRRTDLECTEEWKRLKGEGLERTTIENGCLKSSQKYNRVRRFVLCLAECHKRPSILYIWFQVSTPSIYLLIKICLFVSFRMLCDVRTDTLEQPTTILELSEL